MISAVPMQTQCGNVSKKNKNGENAEQDMLAVCYFYNVTISLKEQCHEGFAVLAVNSVLKS